VSLNISEALERGFRRTTARNGLLLVVVTYALNVVNGALGGDYEVQTLPGGQTVSPPASPLVEVPLLLDVLLSLLVGVATVLVSIAALRVFVGEETEELPREAFTRNAPWAFLNFVVGGVVFAVAVVVGLVFLVIPGLFVLVSLIFWDVYVAVEDESFVEAFRRSWTLTDGNRLALFGLGVVYVVIGIVVDVVVGVPAVLLGPLGVFVSAVTNAAMTVFASAVLASAYVQLTREGEQGGDAVAENV
jgi:hypothetical protein